jgi:hypothetical protein
MVSIQQLVSVAKDGPHVSRRQRLEQDSGDNARSKTPSRLELPFQAPGGKHCRRFQALLRSSSR